MGLFERLQQKPPRMASSACFQHPVDVKHAAYESICCCLPSPFPGRQHGRKRDQIKRVGIYVLICTAFLIFIDSFSYRIEEFDIKIGLEYPMNIPNFPEVVQEFRYKIPNLSHTPLNTQFSSIEFLHNALNPKEEMGKAYGILIVIKSAIDNIGKRNAIRKTWGGAEYLEDTKLAPDLPTRLVFICGLPADRAFDKVEDIFPHEWKRNDIIVADFFDSYGNNTFKSILALKWGVEYPTDFQYLFLVDDDMYVDLVNLVTYLKNFPGRTFEKSIQQDGSQIPFYQMSTIYNKNHSLTSGNSILQHGLYMGQVYWNAKPIRKSRMLWAKKTEWIVAFDEYPYNYYPCYIPGAAMIFSKEAVHKMYYASLFVKQFKIDDVYLGIVANKMGIIPVNNLHFFAWYPEHFYQLKSQDFVESIAIHGCQCTSHMVDLWTYRNLSRVVNCGKSFLSAFG